MTKDIEGLAEVGEEVLTNRIARYVETYLEALDEAIRNNQNDKTSEERIYSASLGINLGTYLSCHRDKFIELGLDPSPYDFQIANALERVNHKEEFESLLLHIDRRRGQGRKIENGKIEI